MLSDHRGNVLVAYGMWGDSATVWTLVIEQHEGIAVNLTVPCIENVATATTSTWSCPEF